MPNGAKQKISLTVPLFSTDYAQVNREISEWNRRARPSFGTIEDVLNQLRIDLEHLSVSASGVATATAFGTVKTNQTVTSPVVYLKSAVDALIAGLQGQINNLSISISALQVSVAAIQANFAPTMHFNRDPRILPVIQPVPAGGSTLAPIWGVDDTTNERYLWNGTEWV